LNPSKRRPDEEFVAEAEIPFRSVAEPCTRRGATSTAKSRLATPDDSMSRDDVATFANMLAAKAEEADEREPGSDTRENRVDAV